MSGPLPVALIGPGAVGGVIAAGLARGGARVTLWGRTGPQDRLPAIRFPDGVEWPAVPAASAEQPPEVVVIAVKAGDMADALTRARALAPEAPVVPLVNGVPFWLLPRLRRADLPPQLRSLDPDGRIEAARTGMSVIGAVVHLPAARTEAGVRAGANPALVIEAGGGAPLERLSAALRAGGVGVERPDDLLPVVFDKLMGNAVLNPLTALTGLSVGATAQALSAQTRRGMEEVVAVARAIGVALNPDLDQRLARAAKLTGHSTSMLQDMEAGRRTEIDQITGSAVELAEALAIDTPVLALLHGIVAARDARLR